jgi:hypothetical protein
MITSILALSLISNPLAPDKVAHFGGSYAATHMCEVLIKKTFDTSVLTSSLTCGSIVLAAGIAKELIDPKIGGQRDSKDFVADMLGVSLAVTVINIDW